MQFWQSLPSKAGILEGSDTIIGMKKHHSLTHLFIIHGWAIDPHNERKWETFREQLRQAGISSTFLGLPGLTTPLDVSWGLDEYVTWVLEQLPSQPVVLLGHSFGGQIASRLSGRYPHRVAGLILVGSAGIRVKTLSARVKRSVFKMVARWGKQYVSSQWARSMLYRLAREKDYIQASLVLRQTMAKVLDDEVLNDLPQITAPTLLVWGKGDTATPLSLAYQFRDHIPHATLVVIDGARHSPHFTHPSQVAHQVVEYMHQLPEGKP